MHTTRKATVMLLLAAFGLPACLGIGLHWGPGDCCSESFALATGSTCCVDCPFQHPAPVKSKQDIESHDCLICRFLAIAKQFEQSDDLTVALERLPILHGGEVVTLVAADVAISFLARGPPAGLPS